MISLSGRPSLVRRSTWARVAGWDLIRVITIRHSAWLASRLPPRLSRYRPATFPGGGRDRGDTAQVRPRAFAAQPLRVIPGGDQQQRGGIRADAVQGEQARRAGGDQRADQLAQAVQLGVQELHAATQPGPGADRDRPR